MSRPHCLDGGACACCEDPLICKHLARTNFRSACFEMAHTPYVEHLWGWRLPPSHCEVAECPHAGWGCRRCSLRSSPLGRAPVGALPPRGGCCAARRPRPGHALTCILQSHHITCMKLDICTHSAGCQMVTGLQPEQVACQGVASSSHACMLTCVPPLPWLRPREALPPAATSAGDSGSLAPVSLCSRSISASAWHAQQLCQSAACSEG
jgi:hypothetical protein